MKAIRDCFWRRLATSILVSVVAGWVAVASAADHHDDAHADGAGAAHAAAADSHGHGDDQDKGSGPSPLLFDIDLAVWTGIVFGALLLVLRKFAWPAITTALDEREKKISDNIAEATAKQLIASGKVVEIAATEGLAPLHVACTHANRARRKQVGQVLELAREAARAWCRDHGRYSSFEDL